MKEKIDICQQTRCYQEFLLKVSRGQLEILCDSLRIPVEILRRLDVIKNSCSKKVDDSEILEFQSGIPVRKAADFTFYQGIIVWKSGHHFFRYQTIDQYS